MRRPLLLTLLSTLVLTLPSVALARRFGDPRPSTRSVLEAAKKQTSGSMERSLPENRTGSRGQLGRRYAPDTGRRNLREGATRRPSQREINQSEK